MIKKHLPNIITISRIIATIGLIFIEPLSVLFFVVYTFSGISDVLDGFFARKFNVVSEFGSKLDSISDYLFYIVMVLKIFPMLWAELPKKIWIAVVTIALYRIFVYLYAWNKYHQFASLHTILNKVSGFGFFAMPYALKLSIITPLCIAVAVITATAVTEELLIHIKSKHYVGHVRSIICLSKRAHSDT